MATHLILETGRGYTIASYGGGQCYQLEDETTGVTTWLQDDDAATFRDEYDLWVEETGACPRQLSHLVGPYVAE